MVLASTVRKTTICFLGANVSHTITYNPEIHILEITFQGTITPNELKETYLEALPIAIEKECFLFLNDLSEATISLSVVDIFRWPSILSAIGSQKRLNTNLFRRAIILPINYSDSRFAENVAVNQGQRVRFFKDADGAKKWLSEK